MKKNKSTEKEIYDIAQFVTVKKYDVLYAEELPRFRKQPLKIYALPYDDQPDKIYNGTGRMGLDLGDKQRKKLTNLQKHLSKKFLDDFNKHSGEAIDATGWRAVWEREIAHGVVAAIKDAFAVNNC